MDLYSIFTGANFDYASTVNFNSKKGSVTVKIEVTAPLLVSESFVE